MCKTPTKLNICLVLHVGFAITFVQTIGVACLLCIFALLLIFWFYFDIVCVFDDLYKPRRLMTLFYDVLIYKCGWCSVLSLTHLLEPWNPEFEACQQLPNGIMYDTWTS